MAAETGRRDVVTFDLAFDYARCTRLAVARADTCSDAGFATAIGALQAAGIAVSRIDDVAGLIVLRTVVMLANEAADAVTQGIVSAADVDIALQKGVNYPRGALAWADALGVAFVRDTLHNLAVHYGEDRYRLSPLDRAPLCERGQAVAMNARNPSRAPVVAGGGAGAGAALRRRHVRARQRVAGARHVAS